MQALPEAELPPKAFVGGSIHEVVVPGVAPPPLAAGEEVVDVPPFKGTGCEPQLLDEHFSYLRCGQLASAQLRGLEQLWDVA
jgi:hypothetical protein